MHHQNNMIQSNIDTFNDMGQEKKKEIMQVTYKNWMSVQRVQIVISSEPNTNFLLPYGIKAAVLEDWLFSCSHLL